MAQVISDDVVNKTIKRLIRRTNLAVAVPQSGNTEIFGMDVRGVDRVLLEIGAVGKLLDTFLVQARAHPDGSLLTLASASGDYTSPNGLTILDASGDLTSQAAGTSGWVLINTVGWDSLHISASSGDAAGSTVNVYASGA